jgi:hypothetical protein
LQFKVIITLLEPLFCVNEIVGHLTLSVSVVTQYE